MVKVAGPSHIAALVDPDDGMEVMSGEDEEGVLATLWLHLEGRLRGEAGRRYTRAVDRLRDAAGRDWVFDKDKREGDLEEAERALWAKRAEYLREMAYRSHSFHPLETDWKY